MRNSKPHPKFGGGCRRNNNVRSNSMAVPAKTEDDLIVKNEIPASSSSCSGRGSDNSKFKSTVYLLWESFRTFREKNKAMMTTYGSTPSPMKLGSITRFKEESPLESCSSIPIPFGFPIQAKSISSALWNPKDDGIQLNDVYNPRKKRLNVFEEICPAGN